MLATISKLLSISRSNGSEPRDDQATIERVSDAEERRDFLTDEQVAFYQEHGYLHIPEIFTDGETNLLERELDRLIQEWAFTDKGWTGPWRQVYMDELTEAQSKLVAMHDLQLYSEAWCRAITNSNLTLAMSDLLGPNVELHHSTLHVPGSARRFAD